MEDVIAARVPAGSGPKTRHAAVTPRAPRLGYSTVPRHWFAGSAAATHVANGVNLLFPAGERFFVRSVRHYLDRLDEEKHPGLAAQVRGFFGQEGRHAQAHERFFDVLRTHGFEVDALLERYERRAYDIIERFAPPPLRLAATVALEHFTAILAEDALAGGALAHAHPEVRRLLEWHAVEELEHKAVAFDVLRAVNPSYALRIAGLAVATLSLGAFWAIMTRELLAQEGMTLREAAVELRGMREAAARAGEQHVPQPVFRRVFLRGIREYLRPGFHPHDRDHSALVAEALERLRAEGVLPDDEPS